MTDYRYQRMSKNHLPQVVAVHEECFAGYYLTRLGPTFLRALYRWYVESPDAIAHVALDREGHAAGFVAGTANDAAYRSSLFRRNWWRMGLALGQRFLSAPGPTLHLLGERRDLVTQAVASILTRRPEEAEETASASERPRRMASLVSIGVAPAARRCGLGTALTGLFLEEAWARGCAGITLSVRDDNAPARRFYESMGWEEASRSMEPYHGAFSITYQKVKGECQRVAGPP